MPEPTSNKNQTCPFPSEESRQAADQAATAILDRYVLAQRTMNSLPDDADNTTAVHALHELADATRDLHHVLMLGWWSEHSL